MEHKAPDAFRTISEAADELDLPQHVLRFWETRFRDIKPMKRGGGRRYYRPDDIDLLRGIRHLLYGEGYTIRGVQRILREQGIKFVQAVWQEGAPQPPHGAPEPEAEEDVEEEAAADAWPDDRGLAGRLTSFLGRDLNDDQDDVPERQEPPLESVPMPRIDAGDRVGHTVAPVAAEPPIAVMPQADPPAAPPSAPDNAGGLSAEDRAKLQAALNEIAACRKLIEAAVARAD